MTWNCRSIVKRVLIAIWIITISGTVPLTADDMGPVDHAKALSAAFRQAAREVKPAVVMVNSSFKSEPRQEKSQERPRLPGLPPLPRDGEPDSLGRPTSVGSGVVVDKSGIVLTNNHVVAGALEVRVKLTDGREFKASDIRTDPSSDLAVLRIESDGDLPVAKMGDSSQLDIGDWVIAIGSPFDLEATVSAGIISATGRSMSLIKRSSLLQTDAAINPGNSGGPLVDLHGEVIGINTAIATHTGSFQGVGFAIPINQAKWIASELLEHGAVRRAWLGIGIGELTADAARKMKLGARSGVWVQYVRPGTPAGDAGLRTDDVITEFAGVRVFAPNDLMGIVERQRFGTTQTMRIIRDGQPVSVEVTVTPLPDDPDEVDGRKKRRSAQPTDPAEKEPEQDKEKD
jgi:serine protease Do